MRIIVTGGAGFVGSHMVELLVEKNHYPIIIDNLHSGKKSNIQKFLKTKKAEFHKIDIRDIKKLLELKKADAVIHLAAIASVVESIKNPTFVNDVNVNGTLNTLEFCRIKKIKKLVFASSAAIFGDFEGKSNENTPKIPNTVYAGSKLTGEYYCEIYSKLYDIDITCLRPFNIYGPRQNDAYAGVISKFLDRLSDNKRPIIYGDGKQTRDFIHVSDIVNAFYLSLFYKKKKFSKFNLATEKSISINNLANLMLKISNKNNLRPIHKNAIPGVVKMNSTNTKKIRKELGFLPRIKLEKGLDELINSQK